MKPKHIRARILQCLAIAECSNCPRAKHGCVIIDQKSNVVLQDGYNGGPRNGSDLCGEGFCARDKLNIKSGENCQIGCSHAESNCICNAARLGIKLEGALAFVSGEPCLMCSKMLHHAGISKVTVIKGGYTSDEGPNYLRTNGVGVNYVDRDGNDIRLSENELDLSDPNIVKALDKIYDKMKEDMINEASKHAYSDDRFVRVGQGISKVDNYWKPGHFGDFE